MTPKIIIKSDTLIERGFSELGFMEILLKNRGLDIHNLNSFIKPDDPQTIPFSGYGVDEAQIKKAEKRIQEAISKQENILIYGDYDVDGITATAVLWQVLNNLRAKVLPFIPDREQDGYGVRANSFFSFEKEKGVKFSLVITVDNGIVANKEIQKIIDSGTDAIIIDHHIPSDVLPPAYAIIHSTEVSGCTLSWLLACQFEKEADVGLAAMGAIADCMPLIGVNRSIVVHGLQSLRLNPSPGIKKLIQVSGIKQDSLSAYDLGFVLGPRINAVGRLSNPTDALRLLCSNSPLQADKYARILDKFNNDRRYLQENSLEMAKSSLIKNDDKLIFIADTSYHPGIIGLIAGRLTEKYYLPSIAISIGAKTAKGSCRSIKELNIIESLRETSDLLIDVGGHAGAAGFSIDNKNLEKFKKKITKIINKKLDGIELSPSVVIDAKMKLSAVTLKTHKIIQKLEPFGIGNSEPIFLFENLSVVQKRTVGSSNDHLKLKLDDPSTPTIENVFADGIAFKKGEMDSQIKIGSYIDIVARIDTNTWQGNTTPQLVIKDIFLK